MSEHAASIAHAATHRRSDLHTLARESGEPSAISIGHDGSSVGPAPLVVAAARNARPPRPATRDHRDSSPRTRANRRLIGGTSRLAASQRSRTNGCTSSKRRASPLLTLLDSRKRSLRCSSGDRDPLPGESADRRNDAALFDQLRRPPPFPSSQRRARRFRPTRGILRRQPSRSPMRAPTHHTSALRRVVLDGELAERCLHYRHWALGASSSCESPPAPPARCGAGATLQVDARYDRRHPPHPAASQSPCASGAPRRYSVKARGPSRSRSSALQNGDSATHYGAPGAGHERSSSSLRRGRRFAARGQLRASRLRARVSSAQRA